MVSKVIDNVSNYDHSIVLMHDASNKQQTVRTLPQIIKKLQKDNYEILPITEDTITIHHNTSEN